MDHDHSDVRAVASVPISKMVREGLPPVTHDQARASAVRFIDEHFNNRGMLPQTSIPVRPDDDDVLLVAYIHEQRLADDTPRRYPLDEDCISPAEVIPTVQSHEENMRLRRIIEHLDEENMRLRRIIESKCRNIASLQRIIEVRHTRVLGALAHLWVASCARKPARGQYRLAVGDSGYRSPTQFCTLARWYDDEGARPRWLDVQGEDLSDRGWEPVWWLDLDLRLPGV